MNVKANVDTEITVSTDWAETLDTSVNPDFLELEHSVKEWEVIRKTKKHSAALESSVTAAGQNVTINQYNIVHQHFGWNPEAPVEQQGQYEPDVILGPARSDTSPEQVEPMEVSQPEPEVVSQPEPEEVSQPEPEEVSQPEPEVVSQPEPEVVSQPEPQATSPVVETAQVQPDVAPVPAKPDTPSSTVEEVTLPASPAVERMSEEQKAQEFVENMRKLNDQIRPDSNWRVMLTKEQMDMFARMDELRRTSSSSASPFEIQVWWSHDDAFDPKAERKRQRKQNRELKKKRKQLEKLKKQKEKWAKLAEEVAALETEVTNISNHINYNTEKIWVLDQINRALSTWSYINTPLAFLPERPLVVDIFNNYSQLRYAPMITVDNKWKKYEVYNWQAIWTAQESARYYWRCWKPSAWAQWIAEHTKMSESQASSMVNTLSTVWVLAWAFFALRWMFTEKWADGERHFSFSFWKIATAVASWLWIKYLSEMTTWKWPLQLISDIWNNGFDSVDWPWDGSSSSSSSSAPFETGWIETVAMNQSMVQFVLLWVPFSELVQCCKASWGTLNEIQLDKLVPLLQLRQQQAEAAGDKKASDRLKTQIKAVQSIQNNEWAKKALNESIKRMNISSTEIANPDNATNTLNDRLGGDTTKYNTLEQYLNENNLKIRPDKTTEVINAIFWNDKELTRDKLNDMKEDWYFVPNEATDALYGELNRLNITDESKRAFHAAFEKFSKDSKYSDWISLSVEGDKLKLKHWKSDILLNTDLTVDWFVNSWNEKIKLKSEEELIKLWLYVTALKNSPEIDWAGGTKVDLSKSNDENYPFDLEILGWAHLIFKWVDRSKISEMVWISDTPFTNFNWLPTIFWSWDNRDFFIKYLNRLWKEDHPS